MFAVLKLKHVTMKLYNNITQNLVENDDFLLLYLHHNRLSVLKDYWTLHVSVSVFLLHTFTVDISVAF